MSAPSLDLIAQENLRRGLCRSQLETIISAIKDPRLTRTHCRVLAGIIEHTNGSTGMAYPGRARLAAELVYFENGEQRTYSEATMRSTVSELLQWGYLAFGRRAVNGKGRALAHYVTMRPTVNQLQAEIETWCRRHRGESKVSVGADHSPAPEVSGPTDLRGAKVSAKVTAKVSAQGTQELEESLTSRKGSDHVGASAPPREVEVAGTQSLKAVIYGQGLAYLRAAYQDRVPEVDLRARVGRLIKDHGDAPVLEALFTAQRVSAVDPLTYMAGILRKQANINAAGIFSRAPARGVF
jgi:hypothetical protein